MRERAVSIDAVLDAQRKASALGREALDDEHRPVLREAGQCDRLATPEVIELLVPEPRNVAFVESARRNAVRDNDGRESVPFGIAIT